VLCALAFLATSAARAADATQVVILDDTLSMTDHWKEKGRATSCFDEGKRSIKEIAAKAAAAKGQHRLVLLRLTEPNEPLFDGALSQATLKKLQGKLDDLNCTALYVGPLAGVQAASKIIDKAGKSSCTLHIVSDFRTRAWAGDNAKPLRNAIDGLLRAGVDIQLVDTAHPARGNDKGAVPHHDNLAVADLRADSRLAPADSTINFTATLVNLGPEQQDVLLDVSVDGEPDLKAAQVLKTVKPGVQNVAFALTFAKPGFVHVTASVGNKNTAVPEAGIRHIVVEVRKQFPVLVVDGNGKEGGKRGGDTHAVDAVLSLLKGVKVVVGDLDALEKAGLDQYAAIYLLNLPELKAKAVANLENYVKEGGGVAFFLGDKVKPQRYNQRLWRDGKGLFPAPLNTQATEAPTEKEKQARLAEAQPQLHVRARKHPVCADLDEVRAFFAILSVDRHYPVVRSKWKPVPGQVEELLSLPAQGELADFKAEAQKLYPKLPVKEERYQDYEPGLKRHQWDIRKAVFAGKKLHELADALDGLLEDRGDPDRDDRPDMTEFWARPEMRDLRDRFVALRDKTRFGDPLVLSRRFGEGQVVACLTSAGKSWNDWSLGPAAPTYVLLLARIQNYLAGGAQAFSVPVGTPLTLELDAKSYRPKLQASYQGETGKETKLAEVRGKETDGRVAFAFAQTRVPGVYWLTIPRAGDKGELRRAYAVNVDAAAAFDLRRAGTQELLRKPADAKGKITLKQP
jgi:hypothetical protein